MLTQAKAFLKQIKSIAMTPVNNINASYAQWRDEGTHGFITNLDEKLMREKIRNQRDIRMGTTVIAGLFLCAVSSLAGPAAPIVFGAGLTLAGVATATVVQKACDMESLDIGAQPDVKSKGAQMDLLADVKRDAPAFTKPDLMAKWGMVQMAKKRLKPATVVKLPTRDAVVHGARSAGSMAKKLVKKHAA